MPVQCTAVTVYGTVGSPSRSVFEALMWLKQNNTLYGDIRIERERLEKLPEDGIPDEILSLIRHEVDEELVEREQEGFVASFREANDDRESEGAFGRQFCYTKTDNFSYIHK